MKNNLKLLPLFAATLLLLSCGSRELLRSQSSNTLTVMSYNIHHANPPSINGKIDLDAIAKVIKDQNPDLVALQEVDVNTIRSGKINQASLLAERLGMNFFFAKAIDHEGGDYGVAILSKHPLTETKIHRLSSDPATKGEPRVLATALIKLPGNRHIRFGSTHLDAQKNDNNRLLQVVEINSIAKAEGLPFIIAGDLNATPESATIHLLDQQFIRTCEQCEFTIPVIEPKKTIDFIAFGKSSPFEVVSNRVIPEHYASDHLPVVSVLKFK
ncbi:endonuclease/exonuclease/phosphatase family protein [Pedobacter sp.]|uniref:endonuclease/exonuclease/phosphatase family protein n=1 Tax=Pedobacter sp. TaxID=1411316 RepID=UPI003D7FD05A